MIKSKAKTYSSSIFHHPHDQKDLEVFAKQILSEFITELENKKRTVKWNYGFDEVIFLKDLEVMKELYGIRDDQSYSDELYGKRTSRDSEEDSLDNNKDEQS